MADLNELMRQRAALEAEIAAAKPAAVAAVKALMGQLGVTVEDLMPPGRGGKRPIKFRDEHGNTWTGVGQRPKWLQARMAQGASIEQFRVR